MFNLCRLASWSLLESGGILNIDLNFEFKCLRFRGSFWGFLFIWTAAAAAVDIFINEACDQKSNEVLIVPPKSEWGLYAFPVD